MSDKLLKDGLRDSAKIGAVSIFAEMLFIRLILATCPLGRCPWRPDWILTHALSNRPTTRLQTIAAALSELLAASLISRYEHDGHAFLIIPNHGQRFKHAVRSPWPAPREGPLDASGQTFMALPASPPPEATAAPPEVLKKPKAKRAGGAPPLFSSNSESEAEWLARLAREFPAVDIPAELAEARRKKRDRLERGWFEHHWLPGCSQKVSTGAVTSALAIEPEPEAWRQYLKDHYEGENWAESAAACPWASMPPQWRSKIARELQGRAA